MKPELLFPEQSYACVHCGKSCGNWRIWVEDGLLESLHQQPLALQLQQRGIAYLRVEQDGQHSLNYDEQGRCHFFEADPSRCGLHSQAGWKAKPRTCRQFPFFLLETPDGIQVGLSFRCTGVQQGAGKDWEQHRGDLEELLASGSYPKVGFEPVAVGRRRLDWHTYKLWEQEWRARLGQGQELLPWVWQSLHRWLPLGLECGEFSRLISNFVAQLEPYLQLEVVAPDRYGNRYLSHLLERKWLWAGPDWLARLVALLVAEQWLKRYSVDDIEGHWVSHRSDLDPVYAGLSESLLRFA
jgi:Fe-S-cluster containining protein